jgi:ABC-type polysaccharide/polyol phosphate transport system ATPase subunit
MPRILLDRVGLTFKVRHHPRVGLKEFLVRGLFRRAAGVRRRVRALEDVSLDIGEGERVGIIGRNGAGKSSLLKVLAGIYPPTAGQLRVEGQISSLFEIRLGFEPEATGWENIRYRGYLQGETPRSIRAKLPAIGAFSELGRFLDLPLRCYSDGMRVRLAFSIVTAVDPQILLIDEVLSVGDREFQEKARRRMDEMMRRAKLLVLVSHDLEAVRRLCDRVIWLDRGRVRADARPDDVLAAYVAAAEEPLRPPRFRETFLNPLDELTHNAL